MLPVRYQCSNGRCALRLYQTYLLLHTTKFVKVNFL